MQKAENRALELFNQALKQAIHLDKELLKEEAKSIVLNNLYAVKQCLYEMEQLIGLTKDVKFMYSYYAAVKKAIETI